MKKILLKKLKADFKKKGFDLIAITFIANYLNQTLTTDGTQTNGKGIKKVEDLNEESAFIAGLADQVKKEIKYDKLELIVLRCDLNTFEVKATVCYLINGNKEKEERTI